MSYHTITYQLQPPPGAGVIRLTVSCGAGGCTLPPLVCVPPAGATPPDLSRIVAPITACPLGR